MKLRPIGLSLEIEPQSRFDVVDMSRRVRAIVGDVLGDYPAAMYTSLHTTAGYLDPAVALRLDHDRDRVVPFMRAFAEMFPAGAGYRHDQMELRDELSAAERPSDHRYVHPIRARSGNHLHVIVFELDQHNHPIGREGIP